MKLSPCFFKMSICGFLGYVEVLPFSYYPYLHSYLGTK